ncbi:hypothetical protein THAOC_02347 [Thalassiosira oceanica]|uniref:Uncharacterized protein n=1 Tax=Thalassiosira oceanica TaxID=159749 RepID=K0TFS9_THAOC|nr:hypothetical protein THAOC_02347 [Thalassiosira oceanica]|eukprot:EJK75914.1 hypothetical protein THAOC_02347 [Thalassiosira oceanica]
MSNSSRSSSAGTPPEERNGLSVQEQREHRTDDHIGGGSMFKKVPTPLLMLQLKEKAMAEKEKREAAAAAAAGDTRRKEGGAAAAAQGKKRTHDDAAACAEMPTCSDATGAHSAKAETLPVLRLTREQADKNLEQRVRDGNHPGFVRSPEAGMLVDPETRQKLGIFSARGGSGNFNTISTYPKGTLASMWAEATGRTLPIQDVTVEKMKKSGGRFEGTVLIKFQANMNAEEIEEFRKVVGERDVNDYGALDGKKDKLVEILKKAHSVRVARAENRSHFIFKVEDKDGGLLDVFDRFGATLHDTGSLLQGIGGYAKISGVRLTSSYIQRGGEKGVPWLGGRIKVTAIKRSDDASDLRKVGCGSEDNGRPEVLAGLVKDYEDSSQWAKYYVRDESGNVETFRSHKQLSEKLNDGKLCDPLRVKFNEQGLGATAGKKPKWVDSVKAKTAVVEWAFPSGKRYTIRGTPF